MNQQLVPKFLQAQAYAAGPDLVARISQPQANITYRIERVQIQGGPQVDLRTGKLFRLFLGTINSQSQISSTQSSQNNDAQFIPPEFVPQGTDVIGVWEGQAAFVGTVLMTLTTDGGSY